MQYHRKTNGNCTHSERNKFTYSLNLSTNVEIREREREKENEKAGVKPGQEKHWPSTMPVITM